MMGMNITLSPPPLLPPPLLPPPLLPPSLLPPPLLPPPLLPPPLLPPPLLPPPLAGSSPKAAQPPEHVDCPEVHSVQRPHCPTRAAHCGCVPAAVCVVVCCRQVAGQ